jgi:hypothetical protein
VLASSLIRRFVSLSDSGDEVSAVRRISVAPHVRSNGGSLTVVGTF